MENINFEAIIAEITPIFEEVMAYISTIDFEAIFASISEFIANLGL